MVRLDFSQFKREVDALQAPDELEARILDRIADNQHRSAAPCERSSGAATPPRHRWKLHTAISAAACLMVAVAVCISITQLIHRNPEVIDSGNSSLNDAGDATAGSYRAPLDMSGELVINADALTIRQNDAYFLGRLHLRLPLDEGASDQIEVLASDEFVLSDASGSYEREPTESELVFDLYADPLALEGVQAPTADTLLSSQQLAGILRHLESFELIVQEDAETAAKFRLDEVVLDSIVQRLEKGEDPPFPLTLPLAPLNQ